MARVSSEGGGLKHVPWQEQVPSPNLGPMYECILPIPFPTFTYILKEMNFVGVETLRSALGTCGSAKRYGLDDVQHTPHAERLAKSQKLTGKMKSAKRKYSSAFYQALSTTLGTDALLVLLMRTVITCVPCPGLSLPARWLSRTVLLCDSNSMCFLAFYCSIVVQKSQRFHTLNDKGNLHWRSPRLGGHSIKWMHQLSL